MKEVGIYRWGKDHTPEPIGRVWVEDGKVRAKFSVPFRLPRTIKDYRTGKSYSKKTDPEGYLRALPIFYWGSYLWAVEGGSGEKDDG